MVLFESATNIILHRFTTNLIQLAVTYQDIEWLPPDLGRDCGETLQVSPQANHLTSEHRHFDAHGSA
jgi:hypothetical protein